MHQVLHHRLADGVEIGVASGGGGVVLEAIVPLRLHAKAQGVAEVLEPPRGCPPHPLPVRVVVAIGRSLQGAATGEQRAAWMRIVNRFLIAALDPGRIFFDTTHYRETASVELLSYAPSAVAVRFDPGVRGECEMDELIRGVLEESPVHLDLD